MDIGQRLRELRESKGLSQGHIEKRTGLFRCYVSRVECGHTTPSIDTLEKWAKALDLEVYQLFFAGPAEPRAPKVERITLRGNYEKGLVKLLRELPHHYQEMLVVLARKMVKLQKGSAS